jgi:8-oxo-dGTP diphosphatase
MSAFENADQKMIPAVLLYAFHDQEVLMLHRNGKANDFHEGKWNGLGGKLELGESFLEAAVREFTEEAKLKTEKEKWEWLGQLHFPNFKPQKNEDWLVNVFAITLTREQKNTIPEKTEEGSLHWISNTKILDLNLWDGDRHFLPHVMNRRPFQGTFHYLDGNCTRFALNSIQ